MYPRLTLHKQDGGGPMSYCEYVDGTTNAVGFAEVSKVATASEAANAVEGAGGMGMGAH